MADKTSTLAGKVPSSGAAYVKAPGIVPVRKTGRVRTGNDLRTGTR